MTKPTCDLQQQVNWQYPERKPLLTWDIKARNYNTIIMECFFTVITSMALGMTILFYYMFSDKNQTGFQWEAFWSSIPLFIFIFPVFYTWTHPRKTFVYRCTAEGFEVQSWNDIEKWKTIVIVVGVVLVAAILALASIFPEALLGLLIGPPLMGLFYYRLFMSKSYWDIQKDFSKIAFTWDEPKAIVIDKRRSIIYFDYDFEQKEQKQENYFLTGMFSIFCPPKEFDYYINFFKQRMPNKTFTTGRAKVFPASC